MILDCKIFSFFVGYEKIIVFMCLVGKWNFHTEVSIGCKGTTGKWAEIPPWQDSDRWA